MIQNQFQNETVSEMAAKLEKAQEINEQVEANKNTDSFEKDPVVNVGVPIKENLYTKDDNAQLLTAVLLNLIF